MRTIVEPESTVELTKRAREGDQAALEALCECCLHSLSRYAVGRVPSKMRDMLDTQDVVNEAVHRGMSRLMTSRCVIQARSSPTCAPSSET